MFSSVFISTGIKNLLIVSTLIFVAGVTAGFAVGKEVEQEANAAKKVATAK